MTDPTAQPEDLTGAWQPEPSDPTQCSGDEGFCPEHGFHRHSLKQPGDKPPACIHPDGYDGECPCAPDCRCCKVAPIYPHPDGDVTVLGPEIFASKDGAVISWRGENYVRQEAVAELAQAIRLTREYVGAELLPPIDGWSWYDALRRWAPHELPAPRPAHDTPPEPADGPRSAVQVADGPAGARHAHDGAQAAQGGPLHDFDRDPAALAWARGKIQHYIDRLAGFEQQAAGKGDEASVHCFRIVQSHVRSYFLGDGGCVIGVFDQRRPAHLDAIQASSDGPSVAECAKADRAWDLQKGGE